MMDDLKVVGLPFILRELKRERISERRTSASIPLRMH